MGRPAAGMVVDHSCHNKLCVNPTHLKQVTYKQNAENISGLRSTNTSGFQGVSWCKSTGRWRAKVVHHGKQIHVGYFSTPVEAGEAARAKRNELFINNSLDRV